MKIAFDEHIPPVIVKIFKGLAKDGDILKAEIVSARDYVDGKKQSSDVPWIKRFHEDGGNIIISGDVRMRSHLHERKALLNAGITVFFFTTTWSLKNGFVKTAMLLLWWPKLQEYMANTKEPKFWEIPFTWSWKDLKDVTGPTGNSDE